MLRRKVFHHSRFWRIPVTCLNHRSPCVTKGNAVNYSPNPTFTAYLCDSTLFVITCGVKLLEYPRFMTIDEHQNNHKLETSMFSGN